MKYLCYDSAINGEYTLIQLMHRYPKHINLFSGTDDERIWDAAPWLFELNSNPYELRGQSMIQVEHCIIFETTEPVKNALEYLQSKIYITENRQDKYFRIWDARVLLKHIQFWNQDELNDFFSVFNNCYIENEDPDSLNKWQWKRGNQVEAIKISKVKTLPLIKTEEELDRELEEGNKKEVKSEEVEKKSIEEDEQKPKHRKFFMD
ncbi:MAG: DUF4123 domain-containing protein [Sphingobacteriales bacterium]|nr:DUF4123 domain-containing protein [Sphingobacteriales bacterium]